jgi:polysaccharide chain length determinant protein (PEP-CTERM system associated)
MELHNPEIQKYMRIAMKRRYLLIAISLTVMSVIVWGSYFIPKKYKAESMVFIEESIIKDLVKGIAVNPSIEQRVKVLRYAMLSRSNILGVLEDLDRDTTAKSNQDLERMISHFQDNTKIRIKGNDLFIVSILDPFPRFARDYINTLVRKYVEEIVSAKRDESYGANRFLNEQVDFFKENLEEAETAILQFRQKQGIYVVASEASVIEEIKQYRGELNSISVKKNELSSVLGILRNQLNLVEPYTVATYKHYKNEETASSADLFEARIAQLLIRYTEYHPEVVKLRAELDALRQSGVEEAKTGSEEMEPETTAANPVYQSLEEKIFSTEAQLAAMEARSAQLSIAIEAKKKELNFIPESRKTLTALQRERNSRQALYNELLKRQGQSWVSKKMEIEDKTATFRIVDPAVLPQTHATPNMKRMILIGIFFGLFCGLATVFLAEQFDTSIKDKDTAMTLGIPLLGVIPKVFIEKEARKLKRRERLVYVTAGLYFCLIGSVYIMEVLGLPYISSFIQGGSPGKPGGQRERNDREIESYEQNRRGARKRQPDKKESSRIRTRLGTPAPAVFGGRDAGGGALQSLPRHAERQQFSCHRRI